MKPALRTLFRNVTLVLVALGVFGAAFAGSCVAAMVVVWFQEGRLQADDKRILYVAALWLIGACLFVYVTARLTNLVRSQATSNPEVKARPGRLNEPSQGAWILMLLAMAMSLLWPVVHGSSSVRILSTAGWLCLIFLGAHLQIFLHELGHLLVAWSLGFRSRKIQVGAGRALWSGTFASGFQFEWRLWPEAGLLWAHNLTTRNYRVRHSLFIAGGPMMDALIVSLGYMLIFRSKPEGVFAGTPGSIVVGLLFVWTAIGLAGNLIPRTVWVRGQELRSDGNILWTLWTSSNRQIAQIKAQVEWQNRFQTCEGDQIREALGFGAPRPAPVNAQESLATFSRQQTRLTSRLLPQR